MYNFCKICNIGYCSLSSKTLAVLLRKKVMQE